MTRITSLSASLAEMMMSLADGNPGAIVAMSEMAKAAEDTDPDSALGAFGPILGLDTHGIYGSRIWVLYSDLCKRSAVTTLAVLRAIQLGIATEEEVDTAINACRMPGGRADELLAAVRARLPRFAATQAATQEG